MNTTTPIIPKAGDYIIVPFPVENSRLEILYHFTEFYGTTTTEEEWFHIWFSTGAEANHTGIFHTYDPKVFEGGQVISEAKAKMLISLWAKRT